MSTSTSQPSLLRFWGKTNRQTGDALRWHPAVLHMVDVGVVAEAYLDRAPAPLLRLLAQPFGDEALDGRRLRADVRNLLVFLVASHDLGKLSPGFQSLLPERDRQHLGTWPWMSGLPGECASEQKSTPHGVVSGRHLALSFHEMVGGSRVAADRLAACVASHHGRLLYSPDGIGERQWAALRDRALESLAALWGVSVRGNALLLRLLTDSALSSPWCVAMMGLTTFCDWVGSDDSTFSYYETGKLDEISDLAEVLEIYRDERLSVATLTLSSKLGIDAEAFQPSRRPEFHWPFRENALQAAVRELPIHGDGSLTVIEAPMGEGKTEAALIYAERLIREGEAGGLYFALPTQATSNQMFGRIERFLDRDGWSTELHLAHGGAEFNEMYSRLRAGTAPERLGTAPELNPVGQYADDGNAGAIERASVTAREWFSRKRALLAQHGVGTIDQALLGVLSVRHFFLRLFALQPKVVVFDEIHAYDVYTSAIIERLLEWLGAMGTHVVLLSATLPASTRAKLAAAYQSGLNGKCVRLPVESPVGYPQISHVSRATHTTRSCEADPRNRRDVRLEKLEWRDDDDMLASIGNRLAEGLAEGGCAAVIVNTVARAQALFEALRDQWADDPSWRLKLYHARYPAIWRQEIEADVLATFGKAAGEPRTHQPGVKTVLVATQVVEQSLDIDFDLMITELAPADLVLQRLARLHRHDVKHRPSQVKQPVLYWGIDVGDDGLPRFGASAKVYDEDVLWRSWAALRARTAVTLPDDLPVIVGEVYPTDAEAWTVPEREDEDFQVAYDQAAEKAQIKRDDAAGKATRVVVRKPFPPEALFRLDNEVLSDDDDPDVADTLRAATRLGPPTLPIVLVTNDENGMHFAGDVTARFDPADASLHRKMRLYSVPVSNPALTRALRNAIAARDDVILRLDTLRVAVQTVVLCTATQNDTVAYTVNLGDFEITLSRDTGLRFASTRNRGSQ